MTYRNPHLLRLASECEYCVSCGRYAPGQIVACHSNAKAHGKGIGMKASDLAVAFLCPYCHDLADGRTDKDMHPTERKLFLFDCIIRTSIYLQEIGKLKVVA